MKIQLFYVPVMQRRYRFTILRPILKRDCIAFGVRIGWRYISVQAHFMFVLRFIDAFYTTMRMFSIDEDSIYSRDSEYFLL